MKKRALGYIRLKGESEIMEKWTEVNKGMIPVGNYIMHLQYGDFVDCGSPIVYLESEEYDVTLEFEGEISLNCIDKSKWPFLPYDTESSSYYQKKNFDNVLYRIYGGRYYAFTQKYVGDIFDSEKTAHYILVTSNFCLEVMALWVINVTVKNLETGEIQKYVVDGTEE